MTSAQVRSGSTAARGDKEMHQQPFLSGDTLVNQNTCEGRKRTYQIVDVGGDPHLNE